MTNLKLEYKFRIIIGDKKVFGEGPSRLLEAIENYGSLKGAAGELSMSYSKAWTIINKAEKALGYKLIESQIGGRDGGGSYLTKEAKVLISKYKDFKKESEEVLEALFHKHF